MNYFIIFIFFLFYKIRNFFKLYLNNLKFKKISKKLDLVTYDYDKINEHGFIIIDKFFNKNDCEIIIKDIDTFINNNPKFIWKGKNQDWDQRIFGFDLVNKRISKFLNNTKLINSIQQLIGSPVKACYTMANKVINAPYNLGSGGGWHRDSIHKQFKAIVYLSDVNESTGNLQIILKSNCYNNLIKTHHILKKNLLDTRFTDSEIIKIVDKQKLNVVNLIGKAGTLIIFDTSNLHRGAPIKSGSRYAVTNYYYSYLDELTNIHPNPLIKKDSLNDLWTDHLKQ